jgi:hypothetical protein
MLIQVLVIVFFNILLCTCGYYINKYRFKLKSTNVRVVDATSDDEEMNNINSFVNDEDIESESEYKPRKYNNKLIAPFQLLYDSLTKSRNVETKHLLRTNNSNNAGVIIDDETKIIRPVPNNLDVYNNFSN